MEEILIKVRPHNIKIHGWILVGGLYVSQMQNWLRDVVSRGWKKDISKIEMVMTCDEQNSWLEKQ